MSDSDLFFSLLRISSAQILRASGLTTAKPSVIDAFTDIFSRYIILLGTTTREIAERAGRTQAELDDVRIALEHVGLVRPLNIYNDPKDEDTRGIDALVDWFRGPQAAELRRVAGFSAGVSSSSTAQQKFVNGNATTEVSIGVGGGGAGSSGGAIDGGLKNEEWLAALKKLSEKKNGNS